MCVLNLFLNSPNLPTGIISPLNENILPEGTNMDNFFETQTFGSKMNQSSTLETPKFDTTIETDILLLVKV